MTVVYKYIYIIMTVVYKYIYIMTVVYKYIYIIYIQPAQEKAKMIDKSKNCILESVHPSPLSCHRGFFDCKHYSLANAYLIKQGKAPIDWNL